VRRRLVNLCFHGIGAPGRELEPDEERYWVTEEQFGELLEAVGRYPQLRMTFDDGNASDAAFALPALRRAGLRASFFVIAGRLGEPGSLSATDVGDLARGGMTVGTHGFRHRPWRALDDGELEEELVGAREAIAAAAGRPVEEAACPFGAYDRRVLRALRQAGFRRVYTVDEGPSRPGDWLQSRYTIRESDTASLLERLALGSGRGLARSFKTAVKRWR
jgi:peptidoglycan/xylan/chitin deacetylase (PgdA/CDA1 family)